jgi:hypothetical protein
VAHNAPDYFAGLRRQAVLFSPFAQQFVGEEQQSNPSKSSDRKACGWSSREILVRTAVRLDRNGVGQSCGMRRYSELADRPVANHAPPKNAILVAPAIPPPGDKLTSSKIIPIIINRQTWCRIPDSGSESPIHSAGCGWRFRLLDFYPHYRRCDTARSNLPRH